MKVLDIDWCFTNNVVSHW